MYEIIQEVDFIFLISLLIIDETDNTDYFIYKFNISKKDQKRIKNIDEFYKKKLVSKAFNENNLNSLSAASFPIFILFLLFQIKFAELV